MLWWWCEEEADAWSPPPDSRRELPPPYRLRWLLWINSCVNLSTAFVAGAADTTGVLAAAGALITEDVEELAANPGGGRAVFTNTGTTTGAGAGAGAGVGAGAGAGGGAGAGAGAT